MSIQFDLHDRKGDIVSFDARPGETVVQVLLSNFVPPLSVNVAVDGVPVSDAHRLVDGGRYVARLIEGYDISTIRRVNAEFPDAGDAAYLKRRLVFTEDGHLRLHSTPLSLSMMARLVEDTVAQTIRRYGLISAGEEIILGLSGGVDSGSLLIALGTLLEKGELPFTLIAATFQDYDSRYSDTFARAHALTERFGVRHELVPEELARKVFNLNRPLRNVLPALMETDDAHQTMYVDHHTTRRTLEAFAAEIGCKKIALGLHTTDLLAGLFNSQASGYHLNPLPLRPIGQFDYIFPLTFVPKKELDLYYLDMIGEIPTQSPPNPWEFNPLDRNFYYYYADLAQTMWPGIEHWLLTSVGHQDGSQEKTSFVVCGNCGGTLDDQQQDWTAGEFCDVCSILARYGYVEGA
jgi:tRNA(Ile)-lysidine synthase TilS/MesJ